MIVRRLSLRNFRNYGELELAFGPGLNLIVGPNAAGKTNVIEAIHYLSLARSFRAAESVEIIKTGADFARIEAIVEEDGSVKDVVALITPTRKQVTLNGKNVRRLSSLAKLVNVIVFAPGDALMFAGSPLVRRNYLDISISKKSPLYLEGLMRYEKLLKERNRLLKGENVDLTALEVLTEEMIVESESIVRYRSLYVAALNEIVPKVFRSIGGRTSDIRLVYEPYAQAGENFLKNARKAFERSLESDIRRKATQTGTHREDIRMLLAGKDISAYGSEGENRLAVIALVLSPYFLVEDKGKKPIVALDDVMSELDAERKASLLAFLRKLGQVFVTATAARLEGASTYEVRDGKVSRRDA